MIDRPFGLSPDDIPIKIRHEAYDKQTFSIYGEPQEGEFYVIRDRPTKSITAAKILSYNEQYVGKGSGQLDDIEYLVANDTVPISQTEAVYYFKGNSHHLPIYIVPADFNLTKYIDKYRDRAENAYAQGLGIGGNLILNYLLEFAPDGVADLQRSYNGTPSQGERGFVEDFAPSASFVFAVASYAMGVGQEITRLGGGIVNLLSAAKNTVTGGRSIDISPEIRHFGNNPHNNRNMDMGFKFCKRYIEPPQIPSNIDTNTILHKALQGEYISD